MGTTHLAHSDRLPDAFPIRKISWADVRWSLRQGWADFNALRGDLVFVGFIYPFVGLIASMAALNISLLPLVFPLAAGLSLLGPLVAAGFYEMARRRELGEDIRFRHFFDVFHGPDTGPLTGIAIIMLGLFVLWLAAAMAIYGLFFGDPYLGVRAPDSVAGFLNTLFSTKAGWGLIIVGNLVGLAFAILTMTISVISVPLIVDRPTAGIACAIETSVRAVICNPLPMAGWGLTVAALLVLGSIPFFVGLAVVLPFLGYATWHLYTRVVER